MNKSFRRFKGEVFAWLEAASTEIQEFGKTTNAEYIMREYYKEDFHSSLDAARKISEVYGTMFKKKLKRKPKPRYKTYDYNGVGWAC